MFVLLSFKMSADSNSFAVRRRHELRRHSAGPCANPCHRRSEALPMHFAFPTGGNSYKSHGQSPGPRSPETSATYGHCGVSRNMLRWTRVDGRSWFGGAATRLVTMTHAWWRRCQGFETGLTSLRARTCKTKYNTVIKSNRSEKRS
jgi:hypothetical protein